MYSMGYTSIKVTNIVGYIWSNSQLLGKKLIPVHVYVDIRPVIMQYFIFSILLCMCYENTELYLIRSKTYNPVLDFVPVYFGLFWYRTCFCCEIFYFWITN